MSAMDDLVAFLRAALDEDERGALKASPGGWRMNSDDDVIDSGLSYVIVGAYVGGLARWNGAHIARWDPARVLAEVEAKRAILDLHAPQPTGYVDGQVGQLQCEHCAEQCHSRSGLSCDMPDAPWPCPTVRLLAQPYADRPGFREEWRA